MAEIWLKVSIQLRFRTGNFAWSHEVLQSLRRMLNFVRGPVTIICHPSEIVPKPVGILSLRELPVHALHLTGEHTDHHHYLWNEETVGWEYKHGLEFESWQTSTFLTFRTFAIDKQAIQFQDKQFSAGTWSGHRTSGRSIRLSPLSDCASSFLVLPSEPLKLILADVCCDFTSNPWQLEIHLSNACYFGCLS